MKRLISSALVLVLVVTTFLSPFQPISVAQASYSYSTRRTVFKEEQDTDPSQIYPIEEPDRSSPQPAELYPMIEPPADYLTFSQDIEAGQNASVYTPPISDEKLVVQYPRIKVDIEPAIYIEGKPITLTWSIDNFELLSQNSSLDIHLPKGFATQNNILIADDNGVVSTTPNETQQTLEIIKNDSFIVQGDLFFEIVITNNDEIKVLTTLSMPIEGFHLAGTATQPIFEAGLPDAQPLVQISSSDSHTANELLFHSHLPRTHTLPGLSKRGYPLEILAVDPETGKNVTQFNTPLELSFFYPEGFVEPEREADLQVFYLDEASQLWYPYETSVNAETNTLNITTDHLTVFDIGVDNWQSFQPPILESYQVSTFTGAATYSYPLPVFEGANGLTPNLSLNYNSQLVDEGSVWTQASWVGLGWSLETASITRDMHSTDKDLSDDTFILGMNGISGRLLPVKTEGNKTYYRLQEESFDKIYSDNALETFTVLTKDGLKYTFGATENSRARYDKDRNCSSTNKQTWSWLLSSVEDRFGNRIDYSYEKEKKTGCQNDIAVYPKEITYGSFTILFETGDRRDYLASWESTESKVLFGKKRLNRIHFKVNGALSKIIQLEYAGEHDEANSVQPGVRWKYTKNSYALTTTLVSIQLLSAIDGAHSPAVKFEYKDSYASPINQSWIYPLNIHLTKIDNSLGGVVQFEYKPYFLFDDFNKELRHARWRFGIEQCNGTDGTSWESLREFVGCSQNSSYLAMQLGKNEDTVVIAKHSIPENIVKPGSKYRLLVEGISISQYGTGTHFGFGIPGSNIVDNIIAIGYATDETNGDNSCSLQQTPDQVSPCEGTVTLPGNYNINDAVLFILNTGSYIKDLQIAQFITRYAVIKRTETDEVTGKSASWSYAYPAEFAMNTNEGGYIKKHREYRGFEKVTIARDDGLKVVQHYHQDAILKGRMYKEETFNPAGSLVSESLYTYSHQMLWSHQELANEKLRDYPDLEVNCVMQSRVEHYQYAPDGSFRLGNRVDYSYETDINNLKHHQLSRLKSVTSSVYNGDAFVTETETHYTYAEHVVTDDLFLSQQISEERLLGWDANNSQRELRQKLTFYDGRHQPNQSKTWIDSDSSGNKLYAQVEYSYHQNGSLQQIRTWPDLVGINGNPMGRLSQTTYSYDGTFPTLVNTETKGSPGETQLQTTTIYHAQLGVPIQVVHPNGSVETASHDGLGRIVRVCINEQNCTQENAIIRVTYQDVFPWQMTITKAVDSRIDMKQHYSYTGFGKLREETVLGAVIDGAWQNQWQTRFLDYTPYGQIETECNAGLCRKTYYDSPGRPTDIFRVDGEEAFLETSFEYGAENLPDIGKVFYTASTNANGQVNKQYKDARGQVRKNLPPPNTGPAVSFEYDVLGQLIKTTYGGAESTIGYNAAGQKIRMNDADMGEWDYVYDAMGNLTSQVDGNRQTTWLRYDGLNRLTGKEFSTDDHDITYTYDENGHIGYRTSMTDASGETHWTYDLRGRMIEEAKTIVDRGTYITQWQYDNQNRVTQMFYPNGDRIIYDYNHQGEIVRLNSYYQTILQSRVFDQNGRVIEQKFGNGSTTHYEYETWTGAAGAIKEIKSGLSLNSNDVSLQNLSYAYDLVGNITRMMDYDETLNFSYDALSRLTSVSGAYTETYNYHPSTGNLKSKAGVDGEYHYDTSKPHAVTGYGNNPNVFEYDARGQMIKRYGQNIVYDAQGNLVSYLGKTYFYDGDGKRMAMVDPDGKTTIYIGNYYETVWIPIDDIGPVDPPVFMNSEQNNYSYFPFVGNGESPNFETVPGKSYYYAGTSRIAMKTENNETIWIYGDHLGSTSVTADKNGEELSRTKYHAWGTTRYSSGMQATDYAYTGQMQVDDIYYYNARWYDPAIGRFMQADTFAPPHQGTQGLDRYAYVNNNPMRFVDPSGHKIVIGEQAPSYYKGGVTAKTYQDDLVVLTAQYNEAIRYLKDSSPTARELIEKIEQSEEVFTIMFVSDNNMEYLSSKKTIYFNPKSGLVLSDGCSTQSAALGLVHEFGHVVVDLDGIDFEGNSHEKRNREENYVLTNYETPIAREMGEPFRFNYSDVRSFVTMGGPTEYVLRNTKDAWKSGSFMGFSTRQIH